MAPYEIWPFAPRAYLSDTEDMSAAEKWAYMALLIHYWLNRRLPTDDAQLRNITGLPAPAWKRSRAKIQSKFLMPGWRHDRVEADLAFVAKQSAAQRAKAKARWEKNTGDKNMSRDSSRGMRRTQQFQTLSNFPTHAAAMPQGRTDRLSLGARALDSPVEKSQPAGLPNKANGQPSEVRQRRAQHSWEAALRHELGNRYADAISVLAADKALCERATLAELRKPGSGVMAALLGLRGKLASSSLGDDDL